jgi:hypothetical protein
MPALPATKKLDDETIALRRQQHEKTKAERLEVLGPHFELLERMKALLPPNSPDLLAIDALGYLVEVTPVEQAKSAALRANWEIERKPSVVARLRAIDAA